MSLGGMFLRLFCIVDLEAINGLMPADRELNYDAKQTAYHAWCRARHASHWGKFVLARAEAQRVYGAASG